MRFLATGFSPQRLIPMAYLIGCSPTPSYKREGKWPSNSKDEKEVDMSNIVRYEPFSMDETFEDLLNGFFVRPARFVGGAPEMRTVRMDVKEGDKAYTVHAEVPGVRKEDIHVTIDGNTVAISAEVKKNTEQKEGEKLLRSERYYGKVYRSFTLGQDVDETMAKAKFENGVLELVLPKKETAAARKLTVE
jgi:HSP20 family protein